MTRTQRQAHASYNYHNTSDKNCRAPNNSQSENNTVISLAHFLAGYKSTKQKPRSCLCRCYCLDLHAVSESGGGVHVQDSLIQPQNISSLPMAIVRFIKRGVK